MMTDAEYRSAPGISKSTIRQILVYDEVRELATGEKKETTEAMEFGTLIHAAILEPLVFESLMEEYVVKPKELKLTTKAGKEFKADAEEKGLKIIKEEDYRMICQIKDNWKNEGYSDLFKNAKFEAIYFGEICGLKAKTKIDIVCEESGILGELKTTTTRGVAFQEEAGKNMYNIDLAFQKEILRQNGIEIKEGIIVGAQKKEPYCFTNISLGKNDFEKGMEIVNLGATIFKRVMENPEKYSKLTIRNPYTGKAVFNYKQPNFIDYKLAELKQKTYF